MKDIEKKKKKKSKLASKIESDVSPAMNAANGKSN